LTAAETASSDIAARELLAHLPGGERGVQFDRQQLVDLEQLQAVVRLGHLLALGGPHEPVAAALRSIPRDQALRLEPVEGFAHRLSILELSHLQVRRASHEDAGPVGLDLEADDVLAVLGVAGVVVKVLQQQHCEAVDG
jgi:hypothetical protein